MGQEATQETEKLTTCQVRIPTEVREWLRAVNKEREIEKLEKIPVRIVAEAIIKVCGNQPALWTRAIGPMLAEWKMGQKRRGVKPKKM
jgi:hypothetical protein